MYRPNALIFDVDGTLADTEQDGHRVAFNRAFGEAAPGLGLVGRFVWPIVECHGRQGAHSVFPGRSFTGRSGDLKTSTVLLPICTAARPEHYMP